MSRYLTVFASILAFTLSVGYPGTSSAQTELTKKEKKQVLTMKQKQLVNKIAKKWVNKVLPIQSDDLADGAVGTAKLQDSAVNAAKIEDGAVGSSEIADGSVTEEKLANVIVAESNKKDDVVEPPAGTFGTAMSVTVVADSVGIIQIVGSVLVFTGGTEDAFDCDLMRTTGSNDDLEDTDRRVWVDANRVGFCSTNGTLAVGPGTHQIDLRVRKGLASSGIDDGTLQALFVSGGTLDNTDG